MINHRVHQILEKIQHYIKNIKIKDGVSAEKSSKTGAPPTLVAVSKRFSAQAVLEARAAGIQNFAENYLQEAMAKIDEIRQNHAEVEKTIIWHYIGQAQSNKCKYLVKYFKWVQTVDDIDFANKLNHEMGKYLKNSGVEMNEKTAEFNKINICIQVNIDDSPTKNGAKYEEVLNMAAHIKAHCPYLTLRGIMVIPDVSDEEILKKHYQKSLDLYLELQNTYGKMIDTHSIGMSQDMQIAIESGSTMLRIGQAIFGERI